MINFEKLNVLLIRIEIISNFVRMKNYISVRENDLQKIKLLQIRKCRYELLQSSYPVILSKKKNITFVRKRNKWI